MLYAPLHFKNHENHALVDTGAVQSAMSENQLKKIQNANPKHSWKNYLPQNSRSQWQMEP